MVGPPIPAHTWVQTWGSTLFAALWGSIKASPGSGLNSGERVARKFAPSRRLRLRFGGNSVPRAGIMSRKRFPRPLGSFKIGVLDKVSVCGIAARPNPRHKRRYGGNFRATPLPKLGPLPADPPIDLQKRPKLTPRNLATHDVQAPKASQPCSCAGCGRSRSKAGRPASGHRGQIVGKSDHVGRTRPSRAAPQFKPHRPTKNSTTGSTQAGTGGEIRHTGRMRRARARGPPTRSGPGRGARRTHI